MTRKHSRLGTLYKWQGHQTMEIIIKLVISVDLAHNIKKKSMVKKMSFLL